MSGHIVVVGSLNMDLVVRAPRHPEIGETIIGTDFRTFPGGKGANQAVAAARLGGKIKMIGKVGQDSFGDQLYKTVAQDGVDTQYLTRDPQSATGVALITVDEIGQNTIVVASGANSRLSPEDVLSAEQAFEGGTVLLLQLESPLPAVSRAIHLARQYGLRIVLNPAPAQMLEASLLSQVDFLVPNRTELALLAGVDNLDTAVSCLFDLGVKHLIVTLGDEGVLVNEKKRQIHLPAHQVNVIDTTAAGDAFVGAFAVALTEGKDTLQAALWGNAAGALAVTRPGAQPSLPTRAEFEKFMADDPVQPD